MAKLFYQGHGSLRFTARDGRVLFLDPYVGDGYDAPADVVLITHQHGDHNQIGLITQKTGCRVITEKEAFKNGEYQKFDIGGIIIEAVPAGNSNHNPAECVGYVLTLDGVTVYCSGDTSKVDAMANLKSRQLDYAILCGDGIYNMPPAEAAECARVIGAKHNIIVHVKPGELFDREIAEKWEAPNKLIIEPGEEIAL